MTQPAPSSMADPLVIFKKLTEVGVSDAMAEAHVEIHRMNARIHDGIFQNLATKEDLRNLSKEIKRDFHVEIADLRSEFDDKLEKKRKELSKDISDVKTELTKNISDVKTELTKNISDVKTELMDQISTIKNDVPKDQKKFNYAMLGLLIGIVGILVSMSGFSFFFK